MQAIYFSYLNINIQIDNILRENKLYFIIYRKFSLLIYIKIGGVNYVDLILLPNKLHKIYFVDHIGTYLLNRKLYKKVTRI